MKRVGNLYEKIISLDNLRLADEKARRGKKRKRAIARHDQNREANLLALHESLKNHTFVNSKYKVRTIKEKKERIIKVLPYYPDRILHHAIMNVLEPIWVPMFSPCTFSCIKGRGIHAAMKAVKRALKDREGTKYCLKIDIKKFYPSVSNDVMKRIIARKIKDKEVLWLLGVIIDSDEGLPIGNYLSQYLSNVVLTYFDHKIKEVRRVKHYIRYADDMTFFGATKEELRDLLVYIKAELAELGLELKGNEQNFPVSENRYDKSGRGIDFLGFVFYHNQTLVRKYIKHNFCRAAARLNRMHRITAKAYRQALCSWLGWFKVTNSYRLVHKIIKPQFYATCYV